MHLHPLIQLMLFLLRRKSNFTGPDKEPLSVENVAVMIPGGNLNYL
jgi:hypothetical protein